MNKKNDDDFIMLIPSNSNLYNSINKKNQTNFLSLDSDNYNSDNNTNKITEKNNNNNNWMLRKDDRLIYEKFYNMLTGYDKEDALKIIDNILDKLNDIDDIEQDEF